MTNDQIAKLSPQPQVRLAFGLMNWKPRPFSPLEYSELFDQVEETFLIHYEFNPSVCE